MSGLKEPRFSAEIMEATEALAALERVELYWT